MNKNTFKYIRYTIYALIFLGFFIFYYLLVNPILIAPKKIDLDVKADKQNLINHITYLTTTPKERNYKETETLNNIGEYIFNHFKNNGCDDLYFQEYKANGNTYKNIICDFKGKNTKKIVVGAHYDVDSDNTFKSDDEELKEKYLGADDNASGVAGVLELATMIGKNKTKLNHDIEFVAYNTEEMPFFDSKQMGSYIHAKSLYDKNEQIEYMIALEMIGYFSDEKIQNYPINFLSRFYPNKGDFIAIVGKLYDFDIKNLKKNMIKYSNIKTKTLSAPNFINGVDFSDHRNYWKMGYKAYMITDSSFFRNPNYHKSTDTIDTLNFEKMKEVVDGVYGIIIN